MAHLKKEAQDFLIYSYFGIDSMESTPKEEIAVKCAYRAYLDLARTVTYIFSTSDLDNIKKKTHLKKIKIKPIALYHLKQIELIMFAKSLLIT